MRGEGSQKQRCGRDVALVHLVAHCQGAGYDGSKLDTARRLHSLSKHRGQAILEPFKPLDYSVVVGPEPHHLADAFVDRAVGAVSEGPILHHKDGHRWAGDAGHRPHGPEVVVRLEGDLAVFKGGDRAGVRVSPTLVSNRSQNCRLHRAAHIRPLNGRACVQERPILEAGDGLASRRDVHQRGLSVQHPLMGRAVGLVDDVQVSGGVPFLYAPKSFCETLVALCGRPPVDIGDGGS